MKVLSQHSCSEPPDRFQVRQGSPCQHGIWWNAASLCPLGVSVASCCFISPSTPHCLSVTSSFALRLWLLTVLFIFFSTPPQTSLTFLCSFPSLYFFPIFILLLLSLTCIVLTSPLASHPLSLPPSAAAWRSAEANRTDGLRWFPGSAHFYGKQPGTAASVKLSGCLQVHSFHNFTLKI